MKKQDAIRILFAELAARRLKEIEGAPLNEVTEAIQLVLDEVTK